MSDGNASTMNGQGLRKAISRTFAPDPWRVEVHADTIEAVALLVEGMAEVSRARKKAYAEEPWRQQSEQQHLEHATVHIDTAFCSVVEDDPTIGHDRETGKLHLLHCALRAAFSLARRRGIGVPP